MQADLMILLHLNDSWMSLPLRVHEDEAMAGKIDLVKKKSCLWFFYYEACHLNLTLYMALNHTHLSKQPK